MSLIQGIKDATRVLRARCDEHAVLLSRQLDEPLPRGEAIGLRLHLFLCAGCRRFREQIARLHELSEQLGSATGTGEVMPEAARERIAHRVRAASKKI